MHGYFMDIRLYQKIQQLENPFAYEEYRKQKIQEKIKKQLENRIALRRKPKASSLPEASSVTDAAASDSRFAAILNQPDLFRIDPTDPDFQKLRTGAARKKAAASRSKGDSSEQDSDFSSDEHDDEEEDEGLRDDDDDLELYELDPTAINPLDQ